MILLFLLFIPQLLLRAEYILNITLQSYSSNGRCAECREEEDEGNGCCDDFESRSCGTAGVSSRRCDTYFLYCLLPINTNTATYGRNPVPCTVIAQSESTVNDAPIDFSQSTVLGLSNPLIFSGISSTWEVLLKCIIAGYKWSK